MNPYGTIITDAGAAAIASAVLEGEKLPVVWAAAGDGNGEKTVPSREQTALVRELWRGKISYAAINPQTPNMIDVKFVLPDDVGGFTIREMGLFTADGVLVAVGNTPDTEKAAISQGVSGRLTVTIHLLVADASALEFVINPSLDAISRKELDEALSEALEAHNADPDAHAGLESGVLTVTLTIPAGAWQEDPDGPCAYRAEVPCEDATEAHIPYVSLDSPSITAAEDCGLCDKTEAAAGVLRFWADAIPTANIIARAALFGPGGGAGGGTLTLPVATADRAGAVKPGLGLKVEPDGTLSVDAASEAEIDTMLNGVFPPDNK